MAGGALSAARDAIGFPSAHIRELDTRVTGFMVDHMPLKGLGASYGNNGAPVSTKLLGQIRDPAFGDFHMHWQPNAWFHLRRRVLGAPRRTHADDGAHHVAGAPRCTGETVECASDQTILDAALKAGVQVASQCREGHCGTCKSTLIGGEVDMNHNGGIRQRDIDNGNILLCCSTPLSDLRIEARAPRERRLPTG